MSVASLLDQFPLLASAPEGVKRLRELILELAVRGKLVPQDPDDEPASELLKRIQAEKAKLVAEGRVRKDMLLPSIGEDEKPFELPEGWEWSRLGELGNIFNGNSINASEKEAKYAGVEGLPFIATKDVGYGLDPLDYSNGICIPPEEDKFKVAHRGAILICAEGGSAGRKCGVTDRNVCFGNKLFANELYGQIPARLMLYLYLSPTFRAQFNAGMTGIIGGVSIAKFVDLIAPLPPLAEQHRIVAKVDELMALCDRLEAQQADAASAHATLVKTLLDTLTLSQSAADFAANWQRLARHFDTLFTTEASIDALKQTLLQLAVMGKLVAQDPNDEPASELLKRIQAEKAMLVAEGKIRKDKPLPEIGEDEKPFDLPEGWEWVALDAISTIGTGTTPLRTNPAYFNPPTVPWVTSGETGQPFISKTNECVSELALRETNLTVYPVGSLIVAMYGQGKTRGQVSELLISTTTNQACAAIVPVIASSFLFKFIKIYFWKIYDEIREQAAGGAQPNLNVGKIKATLIPLPPEAEQHRIVAKVDELMALCDQLVARLKAAHELAARYATAATEATLEAA